MIKLLIFGPTGSMGKLITELALKDHEIEVVAACDVNSVGTSLQSIVAIEDKNKVKIEDVNKLKEVIKISKPNVAVDFTTAKATEKNCMMCVENQIKCVIGTTALSEEFLKKFAVQVKKYSAPAVISPNMAIGVNILFKMAGILTSYLSDWDIEIIESHHNKKQDNYSGTSLKILDIICETIGSKKEDVTKYGRTKGKDLRKKGAKNEIGIHCIRAGDIVGDHKIIYAGSGEYIELKHSALSRNCFATGAIQSIKFIAKQKEDKIFEMKDVLNIQTS
jgi:4-hydroxy-tetrahydrodipicolinate reductase